VLVVQQNYFLLFLVVHSLLYAIDHAQNALVVTWTNIFPTLVILDLVPLVFIPWIECVSEDISYFMMCHALRLMSLVTSPATRCSHVESTNVRGIVTLVLVAKTQRSALKRDVE